MKKIVSFVLTVIMLMMVVAAAAEEWICPNCGKTNTTNFCTSCGAKHDVWTCPNCGTENSDAFCGNCGTAKPFDASLLYGTWKYGSTGLEEYLVLLDNGIFYATTPVGNLTEGRYTVTANQLTLLSGDTTTQSFDYRIENDKLIIDILNAASVSYSRSDTPALFVLRMDGQSMADTLNEGDQITFELCDFSNLKRFNIVAVHYPNRGNTLFIKRVVGLPGDVVELRDGYMYINGVKYDEPYINDEYRAGRLNSFGGYTVPEGKYFVLGDHRNNSNDSRSIGPLDGEMIVGVATKINGISVVNNESDIASSEEGKQGGTDDSLSDAMRILYPLEYKDLILKYAKMYEVDPTLVTSIIFCETTFRPEAESRTGARGLMQIMPEAAGWIAGQLNFVDYSFDDMFDPEKNIMFGCWYLHYLSEKINSDKVCLAAAYLAGEGWMKSFLTDSSESTDWNTKKITVDQLPEGQIRSYVKKIINTYSIYQELYDWE